MIYVYIIYVCREAAATQCRRPLECFSLFLEDGDLSSSSDVSGGLADGLTVEHVSLFGRRLTVEVSSPSSECVV